MAGHKFVPKFPEKYAGDVRRIVARSKWEIIYMSALDTSNLVMKWISEPKNLKITYISPINKKLKTYWPDFLVQYVGGEIELIEVKPSKEALISNANSVYDKLMIAQNIAKWTAAENFCKKIGAKFRVVTEDQLFKGKRGNAK